MKFVKKPVCVEAVRYTLSGGFDESLDWVDEACADYILSQTYDVVDGRKGRICDG